MQKKYLVILATAVLIAGCYLDDRGCKINESARECDERQDRIPRSQIGVFRCESTDVTIDESVLLFVAGGIDVSDYKCGRLTTALEDSDCFNGIQGIDLLTIFSENIYDAELILEQENLDYTVRPNDLIYETIGCD